MTKDKAEKLLNIEGLFDIQELKTARAKVLFSVHEDHGGDADSTREVLDAYSFLLDHVTSTGVEHEKEELHTLNGRFLSELGQGIPISRAVLGKVDCGRCNGRGYTVGTREVETYLYWGERPVRCSKCHGRGYFSKSWCTACRASGKFTQRNGRQVICRECNGTKRVDIIKRPCTNCDAYGWVRPKRSSETVYHFCHDCDGLGEKELLNPVIPMNAFQTLNPLRTRSTGGG